MKLAFMFLGADHGWDGSVKLAMRPSAEISEDAETMEMMVARELLLAV